MASLPPLLSIPPRRAQVDLESEDDTDTASQRSISLSSPPKSRRHSRSGSDAFYKALVSPIEDTPTRESHSHIVNADLSLEANDQGVYTTELESRKSLDSSTAPSVYDEPKTNLQPTYPPTQSMLERESVASFSSGSSYSRKERPESMLLIPPDGPLVLGIALVDFNHMARLLCTNCARYAHVR
jgi:hypothetical protein